METEAYELSVGRRLRCSWWKIQIFLRYVWLSFLQPEGASPEGPDLGPLKVPYPPLREELEAKSYKKQQEKKQKEKQPSEPEYSVVHRGEMTMQDFTNERSSSRIKRPKELVVSVHLPGVDSAKNVELEMFEKRLLLQCSKPHYKLDVSCCHHWLLAHSTLVPRPSQFFNTLHIVEELGLFCMYHWKSWEDLVTKLSS